ncbi:hypothetical protein D8B26_004999 [Coccidioides posadasii str. Silveira]|uniref:uncharacterized protein n=1 Tax=Coccidioides posadasii (strain RMSCC 757 / Silveira) TaxID=443226 RepID=UPI001BEEC490|nr:hypothetical protein D8B26_004999 [Coccidioides posadasii str. Silveira]
MLGIVLEEPTPTQTRNRPAQKRPPSSTPRNQITTHRWGSPNAGRIIFGVIIATFLIIGAIVAIVSKVSRLNSDNFTLSLSPMSGSTYYRRFADPNSQ